MQNPDSSIFRLKTNNFLDKVARWRWFELAACPPPCQGQSVPVARGSPGRVNQYCPRSIHNLGPEIRTVGREPDGTSCFRPLKSRAGRLALGCLDRMRITSLPQPGNSKRLPE